MSNPRLYIVLSTISGESLLGIFTTYNSAVEFMKREAIIFSIELYIDDDDREGFDQDIIIDNYKASICEDYKITSCNHLDITKPIYVKQTGNYNVHGSPSKYLTNSLSDFRDLNKDTDKSWLDECTLKLDMKKKVIQYKKLFKGISPDRFDKISMYSN